MAAETFLRIDADGFDQIDAVGVALVDASDTIPDDLRTALRRASERLAVRAAARAKEEPAFGPKHTGLRDAVADGVGVVDTPGGVRITTSMPEEDEAIIPRGLDNRIRGWRHPVFGNRHTWVTQRGAFSWFMDEMQNAPGEITPELKDVLDEAARKVADAARA